MICGLAHIERVRQCEHCHTSERGVIRMTRTPASLLERLRTSSDDQAWDRFVELYAPLVYRWLRAHFQLGEQDAEDAAQEVLITVLREMPNFRYDPSGSFRGWLFRVVHHRVQRLHRERRLVLIDPVELQRKLDEIQDAQSPLARRWHEEHDSMVLGRALNLIQHEFEQPTWQAFVKTAVDGLTPRQAASELGITANAARIAKSRVLRRLRQEIEGLLE
jgi:RNA polymerase sigma-70 factor (ECF subfamily)